MTWLLDKELRKQIKDGKGPIEGLDPAKLDSAIVGCAVDLHVGEIFRPGKAQGDAGSAGNPHQMPITLEEGETAVVRTQEKFKLTRNQAAIVFPVTSVSIQGLLMTNPGHVDPGYHGNVHLTVINMGRAGFSLRKGDRLLRALVYQLHDEVDSTPSPRDNLVSQELLDKLTPDFLSVGDRTTKAAKKELDQAVKQNQLLQYGLPAVAVLLGVIVSSTLTYCTNTTRFDDRIRLLEDIKASNRLTTLEESVKTEKRFQDVEAQIKLLRVAPSAAAKSKP
jgi:deoxycytidine triphosphate deaminase